MLPVGPIREYACCSVVTERTCSVIEKQTGLLNECITIPKHFAFFPKEYILFLVTIGWVTRSVVVVIAQRGCGRRRHRLGCGWVYSKCIFKGCLFL